MKIDRNKLNTILRSGLNPDIKTRKQLAGHLSLDPTSLTRWFASRDRLGNPRYPVVPDRHVTKILQLFNLDPQSLHLNDEAFRHYCFENSLTQANQQGGLEQKNKLRQKNARQRKLTITDYAIAKKKSPQLIIFSVVIVFIVVGYFINQLQFKGLKTTVNENSLMTNGSQCWTGYSPSLGDFKSEDKADPCHYGKLFHNALMQLKKENNDIYLSKSLATPSGTHTYIGFLFEQLEARRIRNNIVLNIELGKSEMYRLNFEAAQTYFDKAYELLAALPEANQDILSEISIYSEKITKELR